MKADKEREMKSSIKAIALATAIATLGGCSAIDPYHDDKVDEKFAILAGKALFTNDTPYTGALECLAEDATNTQYLNQYRHTVAVGQVKDLTGKYDYEQGGYKVTQGASDMMTSALFKTGAYRVVDRNNMEITELERSLAGQQLVREFDLNDNQKVRKVSAGEVIGSDYKIVGSITELNYNISSGGGEIQVFGVGANVRIYVADIGIDMFLVDTKTTEVVDYTSVKKQLVGYETRAGIFRFFDNELYDVSLGNKKQEPIQLAVRSALEHAAYEFTEKLYGEASATCRDLKDEADNL